jgi:hypothetical protein
MFQLVPSVRSLLSNPPFPEPPPRLISHEDQKPFDATAASHSSTWVAFNRH